MSKNKKYAISVVAIIPENKLNKLLNELTEVAARICDSKTQTNHFISAVNEDE